MKDKSRSLNEIEACWNLHCRHCRYDKHTASQTKERLNYSSYDKVMQGSLMLDIYVQLRQKQIRAPLRKYSLPHLWIGEYQRRSLPKVLSPRWK